MAAVWTNEEIELVADLGYELHLQGKNGEAKIIFEGLLAVDPRNLYCLDALAALSLALDDPRAAIEYSNRALDLSPNRFDALASRCEAHVMLGESLEAQRDLDVLTKIRVTPLVAQLAMRIASAEKNRIPLLSDATLPRIER